MDELAVLTFFPLARVAHCPEGAVRTLIMSPEPNGQSVLCGIKVRHITPLHQSLNVGESPGRSDAKPVFTAPIKI